MSAPAGIPFVKAVACGNDFLLIERAEVEQRLDDSELSGFTQRICDRHNGVGADGVEWIHPHKTADAEIRLINADGSEAEISGNGTRCVAAYLYERGLRGSASGAIEKKIAIQTGAGPRFCNFIARNGSDLEFEAAMGSAVVEAELALQIGSEAVRGIAVSMGNPHFVIFVSQIAENWRDMAAEIQRQPHFKFGVNVELVVAEGEHDAAVRFFERGVGETQSSGTGSCAAAVAAMASGKAKSPVRIHAPGGLQMVRVEGREIFLRGSARIVCKGEFFL